MLPTAATALPAAQFAQVFEKYADLFHDLNSRQLRGAPNLTQWEARPKCFTALKKDILEP